MLEFVVIEVRGDAPDPESRYQADIWKRALTLRLTNEHLLLPNARDKAREFLAYLQGIGYENLTYSERTVQIAANDEGAA